MNSKKHSNSQTLKRIRILPTLILSVIIVVFLGFNLLWLKNTANSYMLKVKIREGKVQYDKIVEAVKLMDSPSTEDLETFYDTIIRIDSSSIGMLIKDNQGNVLVSKGTAMPENLYEVEVQKFTFVDDENPVRLAAEGNNVLYLGMKKNYDLNFAFSPIADDKFGVWQTGAVQQNQVRGWQDIWYVAEVNGLTIFAGHKVPLTDYDYMLCAVSAMAVHSSGLIIFIAITIIVCRVLRSQKKILKAYYSDFVTGGRNWVYFCQKVGKKLKKYNAGRYADKKYAVVQIRLEKFSNYFSCYGENECDDLLRETYELITRELPKGNLTTRYDRSDFVSFCEFETEQGLLETTNKIIEQLETLRPQTTLRFKAGIYVVEPKDNIDTSEAYNRAAIARKNAEKSFEDNVLFFNDKMRLEIEWERKMENDMERALANHEFELYLQPKYACGSEKIAAAEALVRWNHPTEGLLGPYRFIPIFEKSGLITKLDDYMVSSVAKKQAEYLAEGKNAIPISVNMSRIHFVKPNLADHIRDLVDEYKVPHNLIEIELTESAFFDDKDIIIYTANKLREYGFEVSLDDFGSGYSSLNSLRNIPIDIVKLDSGFFRGEDTDGKGEVIVREIIALAKQLNIKIVAEGIEVRDQVDKLTEIGCDLIQGFYFAKPMPADEFDDLYCEQCEKGDSAL